MLLLLALSLGVPTGTFIYCVARDRRRRRSQQAYGVTGTEIEADKSELGNAKDDGMDSPRPDPYASVFAMGSTQDDDEPSKSKDEYTL